MTWLRAERQVLVAGLTGLTLVAALACRQEGASHQRTSSTASSSPIASTPNAGTSSSGSTGSTQGGACANTPATAENTSAVVAAVQSLLATLPIEQRSAMLCDKTLVNAQQWSNFPAGVVKRNGVRIGDMSAEAKSASLAVVHIAAGATGTTLLAGIRAADAAFAGGSPDPSSLFGDGQYYVSVHGTPSTISPWMLQVAGHHFVYNFTYNGHCTSATPLFDGAQPAIWTDSNGQKQDPIAPQRQAMAALFASVGANATLGGTFSDMINGPGSLGGERMKGAPPPGGPMGRGDRGGGPMGSGPMGGGPMGSGPMGGGPTGGPMGGGPMASGSTGRAMVARTGNGDTRYPSGLVYPTGTTGRGVNVGTLSAEQKALVKTAIEAWVKNVADPISSSLLSSYESDEALAQTYVGYAGAADLTTDLSYGRIDGPRVWIEFTVQEGTTGTQRGHYHTIWRDKAADYGADYVSH